MSKGDIKICVQVGKYRGVCLCSVFFVLMDVHRCTRGCMCVCGFACTQHNPSICNILDNNFTIQKSIFK